MIILLGLLDLLTAFLSISSISLGVFPELASFLSVLLVIKGVYTVITSGGSFFFTGFGVFDLVTGVLSYASLNHNFLPELTIFFLVLLGFKSLLTVIKY